MFAYLYEWIRNVAFYLVLVTALLHVLPRSGYQKYIRFFTGLVLILLVLAPVLKLFQMEEEPRDAYRDDSWLEQLEEIKGVEEIQVGDH